MSDRAERMMSGSWFPEDLLQALSVAPVDPRFELEDIQRHGDHPLKAALEAASNSIPARVMGYFLRDPTCTGWIRSHGTNADDRRVRFEVLVAFTYHELYARRSAVLREDRERPVPYDHPAVADLQPDKDLLVPVEAFDRRNNYLERNGYVFSPPPPLRQWNSHYWSTQALLALPREAMVRVRLDPLLVSPASSYRPMVYRMLVYGRELDWERLRDLRSEESARWMPDELTTAECDFTDLIWRRRSDGVHFECEEIPKDAESRPARYFHGIYNPDGGCFNHADAAVRYYTPPDLDSRRQSHLKDLGKVGTRVKLFRIDGVLGREDWATLLAGFLVWNHDIQRYVMGTRDFAVARSPMMPQRITDSSD